MTKAGSNCFRLPLKNDSWRRQRGCDSKLQITAAAKEISTDAAEVTVLSDPDGIFTLKAEQKDGNEGFSLW